MYDNSNVRYDSSNVRLLRESPYVRQLENARRVAGGDKQLAEALCTSKKTLSSWLSGKQPPPMKTYMAALQLAGRNSLKGRTS
jgi:transcriptional regulator with XRE-family HTH domain